MVKHKIVLNDPNSIPIAFISNNNKNEPKDYVGYIEVEKLPKPEKKKYKSFIEDIDDSDSDDSYNIEDELEYFMFEDNQGVHLNSNKFEVFTSINDNDSFCISGPRNSGKSFFSKIYCDNYKRMYPKNKIVVFSPVKSDKSYKNNGFYRMDLDDDEMLLSLEENKDDFKDSLLIFDDTEAIDDPDTKKIINKFRDGLLLTGRHIGEEESDKRFNYNNRAPTLLCLNHLACNWGETKILNSECKFCVLFINSSGKYTIDRILRKYCGFTSKQIKFLMSRNSRWMAVHKCYPNYVIFEHDIVFL